VTRLWQATPSGQAGVALACFNPNQNLHLRHCCRQRQGPGQPPRLLPPRPPPQGRRPPTPGRRSEGAARCSKKKKVLQARTPYCSERRLPTERRRSEGHRQDLAAAERAYCRENTLLQQEHLRQRTPCGSENTLLQREHPTAVPCCCNLMVLVAQAARPIRPAFRSCSCSCC